MTIGIVDSRQFFWSEKYILELLKGKKKKNLINKRKKNVTDYWNEKLGAELKKILCAGCVEWIWQFEKQNFEFWILKNDKSLFS